MKKYLGLIIVICLSFFVVSCNRKPDNEINQIKFNDYIVKLAKTELENGNYKSDEYTEFLEKIQEFSVKLSEELYKDNKSDKNFTISPISIYMALAMTAEAASDSSREEILNALGITYDEMINFTKNLYTDSNNEFLQSGLFDNKVVQGFEDLNNSIWVDESIKLNENSLDSLANNFYVSTYKVPFISSPREASKVLREYIKESTRGLIDKEYNLSSETIFAIVNTYYLKDIWNEYGKDLNFTDHLYDFLSYDNSISSTRLLQGYYFSSKPYVTETYRYATTKTENGFKLKFIVPNEGYTIDDVFTKENLKEINSIDGYLAVDDERREYNHTRCLFPEYEASYDQDIKSTLSRKFGINAIFSIDTANLSNLVGTRAYISEILHQTKLIVDRKGIEGAAVTVSPAAGAPGPGPYTDVYHDFIVDKAFGFVITDYKNTILFSGVIKNI